MGFETEPCGGYGSGWAVRGYCKYTVRVQDNPGNDFQFPVSSWPYVVFIRCLTNPLASAWSYAQTIEAARKLRDDYAGKLDAEVIGGGL